MKIALQNEKDYQKIMDAAGLLIDALEDSHCDAAAFAAKELCTFPRSTPFRLQASHALSRAITKSFQ